VKDTIAYILVVAMLVGGPVSCTIMKDKTKAEAIKGGAEPMSASCAFDLFPETTLCAIVASKIKNSNEQK
jgi:hypothetical protein